MNTQILNDVNMKRSRRSILVADDDPGIVDALQMILEYEGYDVMTTLDGKMIYSLNKNYPDLMLLDIWMSGVDGRNICKYVKKSIDTKNIPVIMISASRDVAQSARDAGADDFLAKPFQVEDLLIILRKHLPS